MSTQLTGGVAVTAPPGSWSLGGMTFDAWLLLNHNTSLTITQHPVETGAAITDHSYNNPRRFSFNVGMSDVISAPSVPGLATRSINAYQTLVEMERSRIPVDLVSKYGVYPNILIESVDAVDTYQTKTAGRYTINLVEIITADTRFTKVSSNPQATDITNRGQVSAQSPIQRIGARAVNFINGLIR